MSRMPKPAQISTQTRNNWLIDAVVFLAGVLAALSGIYFLFLPSGGYQGGRNPTHEIMLLSSRHTWDALHAWSGIAVIGAAGIHVAIHWDWIRRMISRTWDSLSPAGAKMSRGAMVNVAVDATIAVSFLVCAISGLYFLFAPSGGYQGGSNPAWDPGFLFSRVTWDLVHTWSGVMMLLAAGMHFGIHWRWVRNVTKRLLLSLLPQQKPNAPAEASAN